ncbi:MAG: hypothetical protein H7Y09_14080 [Chitinophagaceae bacterium]|nr:hypothetical protein [Anaerolineae bacterium]
MAANADAMVREAIKAYRSNKKAEARTLLEKATELDQYNEQAWMWLSAVVDSPEDQKTCLENVLYINPDNANAKQGLRMLMEKTGDSSSSPSGGKTGALGQKPPAPSAADTFSEVPPTATSSASAIYNPANDVSPAQLDDWVAGLQLKGSKANIEEAAEEEIDDDAFANVFSGAFEDDDDQDAEDDDPFDRLDDMFSGVTPAAKTSSRQSTAAGPFSSDNFDFDDLDSDDDDEDEVINRVSLPQKPPIVAAPPRSSPGRENAAASPASKPPSQSTRKSPAPQKSPSAKNVSSPAKSSNFFGKESSKSVEMDAAEYFREIPPEIKATRLPGMDENYPVLVVVGLVLLIMLNLGAAGFLVLNLAG